MNLSFHLTFDGRCEAAFAFYERCLGGTIVTMLRYRDSPMAAQTPPEWQDKILHATINIGRNALAGADALGKDYAPPKGFFVLLDIDDPSVRFGVLVDRFGIPWEINCGQPVATS